MNINNHKAVKINNLTAFTLSSKKSTAGYASVKSPQINADTQNIIKNSTGAR